MCGIAGSYNKVLDFEKSKMALERRGPDSFNTFEVDKINFCQARLTIVGDDNNGVQPCVKDGSVMVFNGEIYNYNELINEFGFDSCSSDTDLLFALINRFDISSILPLIRGMFAIAYYDKGKLYLARDRFGQKPLYYQIENDSLVFSSSLKDLNFNHLGLDDVSIDSFLRFGYVKSPNTIFKSIKKLSPNELLTFDGVNLESKSYSLRVSHSEKLIGSKIVSKADVDVGAFLSYGIDSGIVKTQILNNKKTPFLTLKGSESLDRESNLVIRENDSLDITTVKLGYNNESIVELSSKLSEPISDKAIIGLNALCLAAKEQNLRCILTGDGGDEFFSGYKHHRLLWLYEFAHKYKLLWLLRFFLNDYKWSMNNLPEFYLALRDEMLGKGFHQYKSFEGYSSSFYGDYRDLDLSGYLPEQLCAKSDVVGMYNSIELRSPLLYESVFIDSKSQINFLSFIFPKYKLKLMILKSRIWKRAFGVKTGLNVGNYLTSDKAAKHSLASIKKFDENNHKLSKVLDFYFDKNILPEKVKMRSLIINNWLIENITFST